MTLEGLLYFKEFFYFGAKWILHIFPFNGKNSDYARFRSDYS